MLNTVAEPSAGAMACVPLDIAVGVLVDPDGRLLIAQRRAGTPGAGCWEFPGGKREGDEAMTRCLARELEEEIGVRDCRATPVIRFTHDRGVIPVRLHVWRIDAWSGEARGCEGQRLAWVTREALAAYDLLPATDVILNALFLPERYVITPAFSGSDPARWWAALDRLIDAAAPLLRLRDAALEDRAYARLAADVVERARDSSTQVLVDRSPRLCETVGAQGLHWSSTRLRSHGRPRGLGDRLFAVSVHDEAELQAAADVQADFAVLSPVAATATHPHAQALGWARWQAIRADHALPVYALGGLGAGDIDTARARGAQGVAAIRGFWPSPRPSSGPPA